MTKRPRVLLWATLPLVGLWFGCNTILGTQPGLPEGTGGSTASASSAASAASAGSGGSGAGTGGTSAVTNGSTGGGTTGATGGASTASASSAASASSSAGTGGAPCASGKPCDCDDDGDNADTAACGHDGGDCNDHDPKVSSKQTKFFTTQGSNGWDYNCSGADEVETGTIIKCPNGIMCDTTTMGWEASVPTCGNSGLRGACSGGIVTCSYQVASAVQGCH